MSPRHAPSRPDPLIEAPVLELRRSSALGAWAANLTVHLSNGVYVVTETVTRKYGQLELPPGVVLESEEGVAAFWAFFDRQVQSTVRRGVAPAALVEELLRRLLDLPPLPEGTERYRPAADGGCNQIIWLRDGVSAELDLNNRPPRPRRATPDGRSERAPHVWDDYEALGDDIWDTLSACLDGPDPLAEGD